MSKEFKLKDITMAKENIEFKIKVKSLIFRRYLKIFNSEILIWKWSATGFILKNNNVNLKKSVLMFNNKYIVDRVTMDYTYAE